MLSTDLTSVFRKLIEWYDIHFISTDHQWLILEQRLYRLKQLILQNKDNKFTTIHTKNGFALSQNTRRCCCITHFYIQKYPQIANPGGFILN